MTATNHRAGCSSLRPKCPVPKSAIRVMVVDDHPVVRSGLYSCLSRHPRFKWIGDAADGEEAVRKAVQLAPDVVLMDISMPRMDGFTATEMLSKQAPNVKVVALSFHNSPELIYRIIQAGARGFVSKEAPTDELLRALEVVHAGESFFSPEIVRNVLSQGGRNGAGPRPLEQLTVRECEVLALIAEGRSTKEIADHLGISPRTTETHRERIMRRLQIHSVAGLTRFAVMHGVVPLEANPEAPRPGV